MSTPSDPKAQRKSAAGLYTIIAIKFSKAVFLLVVSSFVYTLIGADLQAQFDSLVRWLRLDPEHQFFVMLGKHLREISPASMRWLASGTLLYSLLLFAESIGLMFRAYWAVWLAIGETGFFIPLEIFDLMKEFSVVVSVILVVNIAIVVYLIRNRNRLFHHH